MINKLERIEIKQTCSVGSLIFLLIFSYSIRSFGRSEYKSIHNYFYQIRSKYSLTAEKCRYFIFYSNKSRTITMCEYNGEVLTLTMLFENTGDVTSGQNKHDVREAIEERYKQLKRKYTEKYGKSRKIIYGAGKMAERITYWKYEGYIIALIHNDYFVKIKYLNYYLFKKKGTDKRFLVNDLVDNVEKNKGGNVIIKNIPMID